MTFWDGRYIASGVVIIGVGTVVVQGAIREIRYEFTTATLDSTTQIPAGSRAKYCMIQIIDAYNVGATISVGNDVDPLLLMDTTLNHPQTVGTYMVYLDTYFSGIAKKVRVTVTGATAGRGYVMVGHSQPEP